jgi:lipopolysaccharide transport system permease protein
MSLDAEQRRDNNAAPAGQALPETVIDARSGWSWGDLREIWARRELIYFLMRRDIKVRYRQTSLGLAWALLQPAIMTVVFTVFVGPLSGGGLKVPYPLYAYLGFLAWNFFASSVVSAGNSVVVAETLITKVYFPRIIVPLATVGTNLIDLAVGSLGVALLLPYYRVTPGWGLLLIPVWVVLVALAALGTGTLIAALNVRYRDFRYLVPFIVQVWMFCTPSIFLPTDTEVRASIFGSEVSYQGLRSLLTDLNPMNALIALFRGLVLGEPLPWPPVGVAAGVIAVVLAVACWYFRRVEDTFADII